MSLHTIRKRSEHFLASSRGFLPHTGFFIFKGSLPFCTHVSYHMKESHPLHERKCFPLLLLPSFCTSLLYTLPVHSHSGSGSFGFACLAFLKGCSLGLTFCAVALFIIIIEILTKILEYICKDGTATRDGTRGGNRDHRSVARQRCFQPRSSFLFSFRGDAGHGLVEDTEGQVHPQRFGLRGRAGTQQQRLQVRGLDQEGGRVEAGQVRAEDAGPRKEQRGFRQERAEDPPDALRLEAGRDRPVDLRREQGAVRQSRRPDNHPGRRKGGRGGDQVSLPCL